MKQKAPELLIGIGDIHGHLHALHRLMTRLNAKYKIFTEGKYLRPDVQIVFTGDYVDRGKNSLGVLEEVQALQKTNPSQVFCLMGNHELLALSCLDIAKSLASDKHWPTDDLLMPRFVC